MKVKDSKKLIFISCYYRACYLIGQPFVVKALLISTSYSAISFSNIISLWIMWSEIYIIMIDLIIQLPLFVLGICLYNAAASIYLCLSVFICMNPNLDVLKTLQIIFPKYRTTYDSYS